MAIGRRALVVVTFVMVGGLALSTWASIALLREFAAVEGHAARRNASRAANALHTELASMAALAKDYATWDETVNVATGHPGDYAVEDLPPSAVANLELDLVWIGDRQLRLRLGVTREQADGTRPPFPAWLRQLPGDRARWQQHTANGLRGVVATPQGPLLLAALPIRQSSGDGPSHGLFVVGRFLNSAVLAKLSAATQLRLELWSPDRAAQRLGPHLARALEAGQAVTTVDRQQSYGWQLVHDPFEQTIAAIRAAEDRTVYQQGVRAVAWQCVNTGGLGALLMLALIGLLHRLVLRPVASLRDEVRRIDGSDERRLPVQGDDEIAEVACAVNELLDQLEFSRWTSARLEEAKLETLDAVSAVYLALDADDRLVEWTADSQLLCAVPLAAGLDLWELPFGWKLELLSDAVEACRSRGEAVSIDELPIRRDDGNLVLHLVVAPVRDTDLVVLLGQDVTAQTALQRQLLQASRLESIGQLAAGIAHEINTPTQYVGDNVRFLGESFDDVNDVLRAFERLHQTVAAGDDPQEAMQAADQAVQRADLEFLREDIPNAIGQTMEGVSRIATIVKAMKEFAHPGGAAKSPTDLNHLLENTLTVARNEWKYVAEVTCEYEPDLPAVPALPAELNQVFLNLIVNAAQAIGDRVDGSGAKGQIKIATRRVGEQAEVEISDTGGGIPPDIQARVFDPFFTTKEVGRGTGQGLAISRSVVVDKHAGSIDFRTTPDVGTTFVIRLPLAETPATAEIAA
ncbi:MAG: HAMP domain-containing protein [Fimbriimonadaceae bacterium]|nr:HAMP domain-containing protein [Fimbriimonadaceae bacterium]